MKTILLLFLIANIFASNGVPTEIIWDTLIYPVLDYPEYIQIKIKYKHIHRNNKYFHLASPDTFMCCIADLFYRTSSKVDSMTEFPCDGGNPCYIRYTRLSSLIKFDTLLRYSNIWGNWTYQDSFIVAIMSFLETTVFTSKFKIPVPIEPVSIYNERIKEIPIIRKLTEKILYYDIKGRRIKKPSQSGMYFIRQGSIVKKQIFRY